MTSQSPFHLDSVDIHVDELRRQEEKKSIHVYRTKLQSLAREFQNYPLDEAKNWGKELESMIAPKLNDEHFWFLIWKQFTKFDAAIGNILNLHKDKQQALASFVLLLVQEVVKITNLESEARRDTLTGLSNKRKYLEDIHEYGKHPQGKFIGIMYVDLDKIKIANDKYGHDNTDQIIKSIAQRMRDVCEEMFKKSHGILQIEPYRIGGDEMGFLIKTSSPYTEQQFQKIISYLLSKITIDSYATISEPWLQRVSCGAIRVSDHDIQSNETEFVAWSDGLQYLAKLTTGEARTPPEGKVLESLGELITLNKDKQRNPSQSWCAVMCSDVESLQNAKPKVSYLFPATRGN